MNDATPTHHKSLREIWGYLPAVYVLFRHVLEQDDILKLADAVGGLRFYCYRRWRANHPVVIAIGPEKAHAIQDILRREFMPHVDFPRLTEATRHKIKRKAIAQLYLSGEVKVSEIAQRFEITERAVYLSIRRAREYGEINQEKRPTKRYNTYPSVSEEQ